MNKKTYALGAAASVVAISIGSVVGLSTSANAAKPDQTKPSDVLAAIASPTARSASLPSAIVPSEHGQGGIDTSTLRTIGTSDGSTFWVGLDESSNICMLVDLDGETSASVCNTPANVEESGLNLGLAGNERKPDRKQIVSVLLPDSAKAASQGPWKPIGDNLVVAEQSHVVKGMNYSFKRDAASEQAPIKYTG